MDKNARRAAQLGMPYGTAASKLRKNILFRCVKKLGENFCFKCGTEIESVDDLSIEHKLPWENRDVDLFWDLDNIAFSHLKCNVPHNRVVPDWTNKNHPNLKCLDRTTLWCYVCKTCLPISFFTKNKSNERGHEHCCRECRKIKITEKRKALEVSY